MKFKIVFLAVVGSLFLITSCGKYEDGPGFSLRTKKSRLTGEWTLEEYDNQPVSGYTVKWEFKKDGSWEEFYSDDTDTYTDKGDWEWEDKKREIEISYDDASYGKLDWKILRLTNKELWLEDSDGDEAKFEK